MRWQKGQSGNPNGRPKGSRNKWRRELDDAIACIEGKKGKKLLHAAVEMAFENPKMMGAILKKILPDMRYVEADVRAVHDDWIKKLEEDGFKDGGILASEDDDQLSFLR